MAEKTKPAAKAKTPEKAVKSAKKIKVKYDISGETIKRKNKSCPKCGNGVFLADHKDRLTCGRCKYMEKK